MRHTPLRWVTTIPQASVPSVSLRTGAPDLKEGTEKPTDLSTTGLSVSLSYAPPRLWVASGSFIAEDAGTSEHRTLSGFRFPSNLQSIVPPRRQIGEVERAIVLKSLLQLFVSFDGDNYRFPSEERSSEWINPFFDLATS